MITAQVVAELMAAGVTGDALVAALKRIEQASPSYVLASPNVTEASPSVTGVTPAALRQRRYRAKKSTDDHNGNVTEASRVTPPPTPSPSPLVPPLSPEPLSPPIIPPTAPPPPGAGEKIMLAWNVFAKTNNLSPIVSLNPDRRKRLKARVEDCGGVENFIAIMQRIAESDGLLGKAGGNWKAHFDWLLQASSFQKLMEGAYGDWKSTNNGSAFSQASQLIRDRISERGGDTGLDGDGGLAHETPPF